MSDMKRARSILVILITLSVIGCGKPDASHYMAVLDGLTIPAKWELAHEAVKVPDGPHACASLLPGCPAVSRYFLVPGMPIDTYPGAKEMLRAAGFTIEREFDPDCTAPSSAPACAFTAVRDTDSLLVSVFNPGDDFDDVGIARMDRSQVRILARAK